MIIVYTDGACEPRNPGGHGVGGWLARHDGEEEIILKGFYDCGQRLDMTNNIAEYAAVHGALRDVLNHGYEDHDILLYTDSKLVVEQLSDRWKCNSPHLRVWRDGIWKLMEQFKKDVSFTWIPREENKEADAMSRVLYDKD